MKPAATWFILLRWLFEPGAGRKLSIRRIRGGILGLALSLVPLVLVYQVADGMIRGISARFMETGTFHIQVYAPPKLEGDRIVAADVDKVRAVTGVRWAGIELDALALASSRQDTLGVSVRAVPPDLPEEAGFKAYMSVRSGSFDLSDPQSVVLGEEVARVLRLSVGDRMRLVTSSTGAGGNSPPRVSGFTVTGIVSSGYQELDRMWIFINLERGRRVLAADTVTEYLGIKLDDPFVLPNPLFQGNQASPDLATALVQELGPRWRPYTWFELQRSQYLSFVTTRNLLLFIMALIVLVASVNVSSAMIMLVLEKQAEIAILKSIGARPAGIAWVFVIAGGVTGSIGSVIGLAVGALAAQRVNDIIAAIEWLSNGFSWLWWQVSGQAGAHPFEAVRILNPAFYLERIPITIRLPDLAVMFGLAVVLSMAASFFPARRAAGLRPLQIFRKS